MDTLNIYLPNFGNSFYVQGSLAWVTNFFLGTGTNAVAVGTQATTAFNPIIPKLDAFGNPVSGAGTSASTGSVLDNLHGDVYLNGSGTDYTEH